MRGISAYRFWVAFIRVSIRSAIFCAGSRSCSMVQSGVSLFWTVDRSLEPGGSAHQVQGDPRIRQQGVAEEGETIEKKCPTCGDERELVPNPRRLILHALPELRSPLEIVEPLSCSTCGNEISQTIRYVSTDRRIDLSEMPRNQQLAERPERTNFQDRWREIMVLANSVRQRALRVRGR